MASHFPANCLYERHLDKKLHSIGCNKTVDIAEHGFGGAGNRPRYLPTYWFCGFMHFRLSEEAGWGTSMTVGTYSVTTPAGAWPRSDCFGHQFVTAGW
jgi:hypothetical protein